MIKADEQLDSGNFAGILFEILSKPHCYMLANIKYAVNIGRG
jgi:hypothetical protein